MARCGSKLPGAECVPSLPVTLDCLVIRDCKANPFCVMALALLASGYIQQHVQRSFEEVPSHPLRWRLLPASSRDSPCDASSNSVSLH